MNQKQIIDEWFCLDGETLMWKKGGRGIPLSRIVSTFVGKNGYVTVVPRGVRMYLHRVKYYLSTGEFPQYLDHIDGNPLNNNLDNLREATNQQNMRNATKKSTAHSVYKGVTRKRNKWRAYIAVDSKQVNLGVFETEVEAALAYNEKAVELFGEFANLNDVEAKV